MDVTSRGLACQDLQLHGRPSTKKTLDPVNVRGVVADGLESSAVENLVEVRRELEAFGRAREIID